MPYLSVVIPAYNEEKRIGRTLVAIRKFLQEKHWDYELIVVDDGSSDQTAHIVKHAFSGVHDRHRLISNERNRGKGYSVRRGMLEANGEFILFTDADLSTPIEEVVKLLDSLLNGFDLAIGSRALHGSQVEVHQNFIREMMGKIFNRISRWFLFKEIRDSQCGFKCFKHDPAKALFSSQKVDGFAFDAEIVYLAQKLGYKICEVPVIWRNSVASKVQILSDPLKMFSDLIRIRFLHCHDHEKISSSK